MKGALFYMVDIGYAYYFVSLLIASGAFTLLIDVNTYDDDDKMKKEKKVGKILGWGNIYAGLVLFISWWVYDRWFW